MNGRDIEANHSLILFDSCDTLQQEFLSLEKPSDVSKLLKVPYGLLIYHLYKVPNGQKYKQFYIPKKSGGLRRISSPITALKIVQRKLSQVLYCAYKPKASVHGFVPGRSIVTNAEQHVRKRYVFNLDIANFFDSIHFGRVRGIFMAPPYRRPPEVSTVLAQICCFDNKLPQGAPTSPVVSNMVCTRLDSQLRLLAKENCCTYTRYADDITFSTSVPRFPAAIAYKTDKDNAISIGEKLRSIIEENGFSVNFEKVRLQHRHQHQEVTGLTVNQFPNVDRRFVREISSMLYAWQKYGLASAHQERIRKRIEKLQEEYVTISEKEISEIEFPPFEEVLRGKINFLRMVRGKDNDIYRKYLQWYRKLSCPDDIGGLM